MSEKKKRIMECAHPNCITASWLVYEFERSMKEVDAEGRWPEATKCFRDFVRVLAGGVKDGIPQMWNEDPEVYDQLEAEEKARVDAQVKAMAAGDDRAVLSSILESLKRALGASVDGGEIRVVRPGEGEGEWPTAKTIMPLHSGKGSN